MVASTVSRSSVELTAWLTSPSARSSPTDRVRSCVRASSSCEQADVLDRDHRLVGEGLEQLDLPARRRVRGWIRATAIDPMGSPSRSIGTASTLRIAGGPRARGPSRKSGSTRTSGICTTLRSRTARAAAVRPAQGHRVGAAHGLDPLGRGPMVGHEVDQLAVEPIDEAELRLAEPRRALRRWCRTPAGRRSASPR